MRIPMIAFYLWIVVYNISQKLWLPVMLLTLLIGLDLCIARAMQRHTVWQRF